MRRVAGILLALSVLPMSGCGAGARTQGPVQTHPSPKAVLPGARRPRIAVIVMENHEYGEIVGSSAAPYINRVARRFGLATNGFAISHPSLPNYLALTGGSTFGIDSDCTDCKVSSANLGSQLSEAGRSWKAYMEGLPRPCFTGAGAGEYAKKHDPFVYYASISGDPSRCSHVVALTELSGDERAHTMPDFSWISPNLCHDMHDCSVATGDRFLAGVVPPLLHALGPHGLLILTFDEGTSDDGCCRLASGGHIVTILAGAAARPRARLRTPVDHYSVLQTIEDLLALPRLRGAGCPCTPSLQPLLAGGR
jgi:acid phosphatase